MNVIDDGFSRLRGDASEYATEERVASDCRGGLAGVGVDDVGEERGVDPDDGKT